MNLVDRLNRYSFKAIADALDPDFAKAVVKATDYLEMDLAKTGRWVEIDRKYKDKKGLDFYVEETVCSACGSEVYHDTDYGEQLFRFCPYCGAKMENGK